MGLDQLFRLRARHGSREHPFGPPGSRWGAARRVVPPQDAGAGAEDEDASARHPRPALLPPGQWRVWRWCGRVGPRHSAIAASLHTQPLGPDVHGRIVDQRHDPPAASHEGLGRSQRARLRDFDRRMELRRRTRRHRGSGDRRGPRSLRPVRRDVRLLLDRARALGGRQRWLQGVSKFRRSGWTLPRFLRADDTHRERLALCLAQRGRQTSCPRRDQPRRRSAAGGAHRSRGLRFDHFVEDLRVQERDERFDGRLFSLG